MTPRSTLETLALRLPPHVDLRQTLKSIAHAENITAGIILSGIGSLSTVCLRFAGQDAHTTIDGKHEILTLAGTIGIDGIHLHMSVANAHGEVIGGHVVDGCKIYTTAEITIGILPELQFQRVLDERTGFAELSIELINYNKSDILFETDRLSFEPLNVDHADELFPILTTPAVLAFIDPTATPTITQMRLEYAACACGPIEPILPIERWFNMAIRLKAAPTTLIGRVEATGYGTWGEIAYLLGEDWWGKGLAFEAMNWWHDYLGTIAPETIWWATVHPDNQRSIRLLTRLGYDEVDATDRPELQSYDSGDRCFVRT